ncbi:hypothetical protein GGI12_001342 [Dipsacomyces acuminosporus]|nr:hypothetical protein GGI12_001342 [Dipsacomyces acuminosporus]
MPALAQHSSVYDRINRIVVPYGGQTPAGFSKTNNLAIYSAQFEAWGASTAVNSALKRYLHTAVIQEKSGDMIIYGGTSDTTTDSQGVGRWNGTYRMVLDVDRHMKHAAALGRATAKVTVGQIITDNDTHIPDTIAGVVQHSSVLVDDRQMVVMGGNTNKKSQFKYDDIPFASVYIYDVDTQKWSTQKCNGKIPYPRSEFSASLYKDSIFIFGGINPGDWTKPFNDLYQLNTTTWTWTDKSTASAPPPRYAHRAKTLGHYLIITHGFLAGDIGDPEIYFYDILKGEFVDSYSPKGITRRDLDIQWAAPISPGTKGVLSLALLLLAVAVSISLYYLGVEVWYVASKKPRARAAGISARNHIRSRVMSYADNIRGSAYYQEAAKERSLDEQRAHGEGLDMATVASQTRNRKLSNPIKSVLAASESLGASRSRHQTASEGTSTVISGDRAGRGNTGSQVADEGMRHTRILDEVSSDSPYLVRRLTISSHIPTYTAPRMSRVGSDVLVGEPEFADESGDLNRLSAVNSDGYPMLSSVGLSMIGEEDEEEILLAPRGETHLSHRASVDSALKVVNQE